ncbi:ATP-dependent zinc metalloprotease FTSH 5, mitochondrial [Geodia barretti]|uniref:ATP-dependent zinc metalloprotease FTSH 5, mitochondrial n=1 Tax=Geodia barretti TaxID=519541 RepID=A0AA35WE65_GEOBA|nr:ATP-dependent zinc metalloprotease FTSH 5, mitochondrial [Geodia barretti]
MAVPASSTSAGLGVGGLGLVSEALAVLNGAHLNYGGGSRLGNLLRRYHHSPAAAGSSRDSCQSSSCSATDNHSGSIQSMVISELGVSQDTWTKAIGSFRSDFFSLPSAGYVPSTSQLLQPIRGSKYRGWRWFQGARHFSSLARHDTLGRRRTVGFNGVSSSPWRPTVRHISFVQLEERANSETDNPLIQARYLEAVLDRDPHYVVRRFESGNYAVDAEVRRIYQRALEIVEVSRDMEPVNTSFPAGSSGKHVYGSRENPVHIVNLPQKGSWFRELWYLARFVIIAFFVTTFISSALMTHMKNGTHQMTKDFRPDPSDKLYTFDDVQGIEEAKAEVQEIVEFLKYPERFQRLGARLPTGLLLIGPPGTGKTLLAKAIAGEAEVPFFFVSGSEFDEMFVGVGASRMRKLFEQARKLKPCVVFIDELDAVGGARVASSVHPYSRMTLNQLLVEMDGYKELEGVVIIGATNFPESLDKALIRPGRFDSRINIPLPDVRSRHEILKVHAKKVLLSSEVDLEVVARGTTGFSGADLANLINQAALHGSAIGNEAVTRDDVDFARDKIIMGPERKSAVIEEKNRRLVAYHEGGHAIVALYTPGALPIHKATIMPRGSALGMVSMLSEKDELSWSRKQLMARLDVAMGGRVAEEIVFGHENVTSGKVAPLFP